MSARTLVLTVLNGPDTGRRFAIAEGAPRRIGSSIAADDAISGDPNIAPVHVAVRWEDGIPRVRALQSVFGTWLNGQGASDAPLADGDVLCIGGTHLRAQLIAPVAPVLRRNMTPKESALDTLRSAKGRLFVVLDAAREDRVRELLRLNSYHRSCLYDGWGEEVFGEAAPWLVQLWKTGRFVEQLIDEGLGRAWGVFLTSRAPFKEVRRQCRRLLQVNVEGQGKMLFRWYDPGVLQSVYPHMDRTKLHGSVIDAWIVEDRAGERLVTLS
ncbi:MAG: DUF4123 domain-containing protein [Polyangiales bacterium]